MVEHMRSNHLAQVCELVLVIVYDSCSEMLWLSFMLAIICVFVCEQLHLSDDFDQCVCICVARVGCLFVKEVVLHVCDVLSFSWMM